MKDEMPTPYPVWPKMGFRQWLAAMEHQHRWLYEEDGRFCKDCGEVEELEEGQYWPTEE